jgi:hypothetical protein
VEPHVPTLEDLYFTIRRQAGGTTTSDDDAPGPLAPIAPRWGSVTPVAPPMHAPDDRSPLSGASFDAPSTPEESRR